MHILVVRFSLPAEQADRVQRALASTASDLNGEPGFRSFKTLKSPTGDEVLAVVEWDDQASFELWTESAGFSRFQIDSNPRSPVKTDFKLYEVTFSRP